MLTGQKLYKLEVSSQTAERKSTFNHPPVKDDPSRWVLLFSAVMNLWKRKMKIELESSTGRFRHRKKKKKKIGHSKNKSLSTMQLGSVLRLLSWSRQVLVWVCVDQHLGVLWVCTSVIVCLFVRALWGRMCYGSSSIVSTSPPALPSFLLPGV